MRIEKLPGWVTGDEASVRREVQKLVGLTPAQRWALTRLCARDALWAVRNGDNPERALAFQDPLPPSTVAALARMRIRRAG